MKNEVEMYVSGTWALLNVITNTETQLSLYRHAYTTAGVYKQANLKNSD